MRGSFRGTGAFTAPGAVAVDIAPGGSHAITIEFQPLAVGPIASAVLIVTSDQDTPTIEVPLSGEGIDLLSCDFEIRTPAVNFHDVQLLRSARQSIEIYNRGAHDCVLTGLRLEAGTDAEFTIASSQIHGLIIAPNTSIAVPVEYAPQSVGTHVGTIELSLSSSTSPFNLISLSGNGVSTGLLIYPNAIDFGRLGTGCTTRARTVRIFNPSTASVVIDRIDWAVPPSANNSAFGMDAFVGPTTLPAGQSAEITVTFSASAVSTYANALVVSARFDGQPATYIVSLVGQGAVVPTQEDRFVQQNSPKADVLFVVDFTGSMGQAQSSLAASFSSFVAYAQAQSLDFQVGVTTTDTGVEAGRLMHADQIRGNAFGGVFTDRIVTAATGPDPGAVFTRNVQGRNLSGGSAVSEAGFFAAYQALTPTLLTGSNAGFLRPDAALTIVFVSDEPEQSGPAIGAPSGDVGFYLSYFSALKGPARSHTVSLSAIVGGPNGCAGAGGTAAATPRYLDAVQRTHGVFQSICESDWSAALEQIAGRTLGLRSRFVLSNPPAANTVEVFIDGVSVPATGPSGAVSWAYEFAENSVTFAPAAVPQPGAQIRVRYAAECL